MAFMDHRGNTLLVFTYGSFSTEAFVVNSWQIVAKAAGR